MLNSSRLNKNIFSPLMNLKYLDLTVDKKSLVFAGFNNLYKFNIEFLINYFIYLYLRLKFLRLFLMCDYYLVKRKISHRIHILILNDKIFISLYLILKKFYN